MKFILFNSSQLFFDSLYLKEPNAEMFAEAMKLIVDGGSELKTELGKNGRRRVLNCFAFNAFANKLNGFIDQVLES